MKLLDYIRGLRKGKEAHRLERESMQDPFLADAMDGYSQVEGNHEQRIEKLRMQVSAHSAKKNNSPVLPAEDLILYYEERDLLLLWSPELQSSSLSDPEVSGFHSRLLQPPSDDCTYTVLPTDICLLFRSWNNCSTDNR